MRYHSETTTVYRSAARPRSRPGRPVCRLGGEAVGSAARGAAQVSLARGRRGEPGGRASPAYGFGSHRGGCCDSVSPRNWPVATYAIGPLQPAIGPLQPVRGPDSERKSTPREPKRDVYRKALIVPLGFRSSTSELSPGNSTPS